MPIPQPVPAGHEIDALTRLAIRHGTDKWGPHFYTPVYHALFSPLREKPVRLLEIGVGGYEFTRIGGASLMMWAEYFPHGRIVGIDIAEKTLDLGPRVTLRCGSQDDPAFLARVAEEEGPFDIVIDDGSHVPDHVAASFHALFPRLAADGFYVIEDVQTSYWSEYGGSILDGGATMRLARWILESLNHAEVRVANPKLHVSDIARQIRSLQACHNLLIVQKGDNSEPSNHDYRLDSPHGAWAVRAMEEELERFPTPAGYANLIETYAIGRDYARAQRWLDTALAMWPNEPALLLAAINVAGRRGDAAAKVRLCEHLARLKPDDAGVRRMLTQSRAEWRAVAF